MSPRPDFHTQVREILKRARDDFLAYKETLLKDHDMQDLLGQFKIAHEKLSLTFKRLSIFDLCSECGNGPKRGCCIPEAGTWYDSVQILINLLLDLEISLNLEANACPFLGPKGCILAYKNDFCINFFCNPLKERLGLENIRQLQSLAGEEIRTGILLEYRIKEILHQPSKVLPVKPDTTK